MVFCMESGAFIGTRNTHNIYLAYDSIFLGYTPSFQECRPPFRSLQKGGTGEFGTSLVHR